MPLYPKTHRDVEFRAMSRREREDEVACAASLEEHLRLLGEADARVEKECDDPPDYWLTLGVDRLPVEITSLADQELLGSIKRCNKFFESLEKRCQEAKVITVSCELDCFEQILLPGPKSREWNKLLEQGVEAVRKHAADPERRSVYLKVGGPGKMSVRPLFGNKPRLIYHPGHVRHSIVSASRLQEILDDKGKVLAKNPEFMRLGRAIIILDDKWGFSHTEDLQAAVAKVSLPEWLHSLFWVSMFPDADTPCVPGHPGTRGTFLFTRESRWQKPGSG